MSQYLDNVVRQVIGEVFVQWRRVFNSATSPLLIPVNVVEVPTDSFTSPDFILVFASDATKAQMNLWNRTFKHEDFGLDITFNGEANENFIKVPLTGFSIRKRRSFKFDTTAYVSPDDEQVEE